VLGLVMGATATPATAAPVTTTFTYTGGQQTFVVPAGVQRITVDAAGAPGEPGTVRPQPGGLGGRIRAELPVMPGQTLYVGVGGPGYGGGGPKVDSFAGAGGGASDVRTCPVGAGCESFASRLVVAGGGGGAGGNYGGGSPIAGAGGRAGFIAFGGGNGAGASGVPQGGTGGLPGTQTAPGAGGGSPPTIGGQPGRDGRVRLRRDRRHQLGARRWRWRRRLVRRRRRLRREQRVRGRRRRRWLQLRDADSAVQRRAARRLDRRLDRDHLRRTGSRPRCRDAELRGGRRRADRDPSRTRAAPRSLSTPPRSPDPVGPRSPSRARPAARRSRRAQRAPSRCGSHRPRRGRPSRS
jgi:hypothetical protein